MADPAGEQSCDGNSIHKSEASLSVSLNDRIDLLASELRARWKLGQRVAVESLATGTFAGAFASVTANDEHLLDLLYHELLIRQEFGEQPAAVDFASRFPALRERIERLFAVHAAIEDDDWDGTALTGEPSPAFDDALPRLPVESGTATAAAGSATPQWPRRARTNFAASPPPGYELLEELGRGGMAVVFRARQQVLNRTVALKMLLGGGAASAEVLARVRQEARAVAQLQHPGIVQIHEVGEHLGLPFLSLEFVAGGTLQEWLRGQPLPPQEACAIVEQLAQITQFAHQNGIVHRDLKPANILLTERPAPGAALFAEVSATARNTSLSARPLRVKIGDFGLARGLGHQSDLTATGQVIGTPSYMAPEQAAGTGDDASPAQDIYSLGAILFELLTGRPPFRGATLFDTLEQVRTDEPVPPRRLQPRVPADLETVCLECLQKSPARRYASAQLLADDLRAVQRHEPIQARPQGAVERLAKLIRRHPAVSALAILSALILVAGITGILIENRRANTRETEARHQRDLALRLSREIARERDDARAQRTAAELQRTLAEAARSEAVVARQHAEQSLDQSLTAINALANYGVELRSVPQQQLTSRRILDETLKLYDQLEAAHGSSQRLRRQRAFTLIRAGELRALLREIGKADELLRRGIALLEEEIRSTTGDPDLHRYLAYAWWVLGNLMKDTNRLADAQTAYENSLNASSDELRHRPDSRFLLRSRANVLTNLCAVMVGQNRHREAMPTFEQAVSLLRSLLAESPEDFGSQSELALALHDYSTTLRVLQQPEAATRAFDEAFAIRELLLQRDPEDHGNRVLFARLYMSCGWLARSANQPAAALSEFRRAGAMLQPSVDAFPTFFEYQLALLLSQEAQLEASLATGDPATTESIWSVYTTQLLQCRDLFPLERRIVHKMETWLPHRCEHLFEQQRSDECRALFASLLSAAKWLASEEAAALSPEASADDRAGWFNNFAWYLTIAPEPAQRDLPRAVAMARTSLELVPDVANHLHTLATALYENGQYADALETIELAIRKLPADLPARQRAPLINVILASAHWQLGHGAEARQALSQVPDPPAGLTRNAAELRRHIGAVRSLIPPDTRAE